MVWLRVRIPIGAPAFSNSRRSTSRTRTIRRETFQGERVDALTKWLDALVTNFSDRIHPLDGKVYTRASEIMRRWQRVPVPVRYHDVLLAATAQVYGHGLLTDSAAFDFGSWVSVKVASPPP